MELEHTLPMGPSDRQIHAAVWLQTSGGRIVGTPRYMSPEQWRGEAADSRSDQFSFCVALWEALLGRSPFFGNSIEEIREATSNGVLSERPGAVGLSPALRRALERGLAVEPEARFPDMETLLVILERWMKRRQRAPVLAASGIMSIALGGVLYTLVMPGNPCANADTRMKEVWNSERRAAVREVLADSRVPGAVEIWQIIEPQLSDYAERWTRERIEACTATYVHGEQTEELFNRRVICLEQGRQGLESLMEEVLDEETPVDRSMVMQLPVVVADLPELAVCNTASMHYGLPQPPGSQRSAVTVLRSGLRRARTKELLGRRNEALVLAQEQYSRAESLGYSPVIAEASYQMGRLLTYTATDEDVRRGEALIREAVYLATGQRHDELVADALAFLLLSAYHNHDATDCDQGLLERAAAASHRLGDPPLLRAKILRRAGLVWQRRGRYELAEEKLREAIATLSSAEEMATESVLHTFLATYLHDLANAMREQLRYDEARQLYAKARRLYVEMGANDPSSLRNEHPYVTDLVFDMAVLDLRESRYDEAGKALDEVLRLQKMYQGERHPEVGRVYLEIARLSFETGDLERAERTARIGLRILKESLTEGDARIANGRQIIGAIYYQRRDYLAALEAYRKALSDILRRLGRGHIEVAYARANIAEVELMLKRYKAARTSLVEARRILDESNLSEPRLRDFLETLEDAIRLDQE